MAGASFTLNDDDINNLIEAIQKFEGSAEDAIGEYLKEEVPGIVKPSIQNLIPVSDRDKRHAKTSAPFTEDMEGKLSIYIHTKKQWHYLYFPDEGEGTSKGQQPHDFMSQGVESEYDTLVNGMLDSLINNFNKTIQ